MEEAMNNEILGGSTLAGPAQESLAGRELRQGRSSSNEENAEEEGGGGQSLRERVMAARRAMNIKQRAKDKIEEKVMSPARQATGGMLRWAWISLIPSWGLSLVYINLHVFLRFVLGEKLFCKLGNEWMLGKVGGETGETVEEGIGIVEAMALFALDLLVLFFLGAVLAFIIMIWTWIDASLLEKVVMAGTAIKGLGWATISALIGLFK